MKPTHAKAWGSCGRNTERPEHIRGLRIAVLGRECIKEDFLILSWALYDLANQFFALNVVSLYFPRWLAIEKKSPEIFYGLSFGISMLLVGICAPIMGAISDIKETKRRFLVYFTLLSIVFTMGMGFSDSVFLSLVFFAVANFGCQGAVVFYNALMVEVAPRERMGFVSGLGRMFGYSGAILALYLTKPVVLKAGYKAAFFITAVSFLIFALPCMIFVKENPSGKETVPISFLNLKRLSEVFRRMKLTFLDTDRHSELKDFLKAAFFGLCVVNVIILFMSIYASEVFGLKEPEIINLIGFSTIFAIAGSIFSGFISDIVGYKKSLVGIFFLWGLCILGAGFLGPPFHWLIGALVGISLGATWVVSRALVVKIIPQEKIGEVFGLFNLVGYISGIIGPLFWGAMLILFSPLGILKYRIAFLSLILFIAVGIIFLLRMRTTTGKQGT